MTEDEALKAVEKPTDKTYDKGKKASKEAIEEIINKHTIGNYLLNSSDKAQIISEIIEYINHE